MSQKVKYTILVNLSLPVFVVCVMVATVVLVTSPFGFDGNERVSELALTLILGSGFLGAILGCIVWFLFWRASIGGDDFYKVLRTQGAKVFVPGSKAERIFAPVLKRYDEWLKWILGVDK